MTFTPFQQLIPKTARKYGIYGAMQAIRVCNAANRSIEDLFKTREHKAVKAKSITGGILKIIVPSSTWAQEITLNRIKLIDLINGRIGRKAVKGIKTTVKNA